MAPRYDDLDIHDEILVYLLKAKKSPVDVMQKFKKRPRDEVYDAASYLQRKGWIKARYPFIGTGFSNDDLGETGFIPVENPEFVMARLTYDGADQARYILRTRRPGSRLIRWVEKFWSVFLVIAAILGIIASLMTIF